MLRRWSKKSSKLQVYQLNSNQQQVNLTPVLTPPSFKVESSKQQFYQLNSYQLQVNLTPVSYTFKFQG